MPHLECHQHTSNLVFQRQWLTEDLLWTRGIRVTFPNLSLLLPILRLNAVIRLGQFELYHEFQIALHATPRPFMVMRTLYRELVEVGCVVPTLSAARLVSDSIALFLVLGARGKLSQQP